MKKLTIFLLSTLIVNAVAAQWFVSPAGDMYNINPGRVAIGISNPVYPFQIWDGGTNQYTGIGFIPGTSSTENAIIKTLKTMQYGLILRAENQDAGRGQAAIHLKNSDESVSGQVTVMANYIDLRTGTNYTDNITGNTFGSSALYINNNQQVGIGTTNPGTFKLAVEGALGARSVKVTLTNPWPDYVFNKEYQLPDLLTVENYISKYHHLPGIPSAEEVQKTGNVDLGDMNAKLLEKVEQLMLYVINLSKENEEIKQKLEALSKK